jgi:hypothetical protein
VAGFTFLFFPLNIETVVWLSNWNTLLSVFFLLLALLIYAKESALSRAQSLLLGFTLLLSLSAKEFALLFPLFALGIDLLLERKIRWKIIALSICTSILYLALRFFVIGGLGGYTNTAPHTWNWSSIWTFARLGRAYSFHFFHTVTTPFVLKLLAVASVNVLVLGSLFYLLALKKKSSIKNFFILGILIYTGALLGFNLINPLQPHLANSRLFIMSNVFFCLLVGFCSTIHSSRFFRVASFTFVVLLACMLPFQLLPWRMAGIASQRILAEIASPDIQSSKKITIANIPDNYLGAFIFRNGIENASAITTHTTKYAHEFIKNYQDQRLPIKINGHPEFDAFASR